MSTPLPKPDEKLKASVNRLRSNVDFQLLVKHHEALKEWTLQALVAAPPDNFAPLQGKARALQDFLDLAKGS